MSAEKGQQTFFFMLQRPSHFYFYYLKLKPEKVDLGVLETNKIKDGQHQSSSCKLSGMLFFYEKGQKWEKRKLGRKTSSKNRLKY